MITTLRVIWSLAFEPTSLSPARSTIVCSGSFENAGDPSKLLKTLALFEYTLHFRTLHSM